MDERRFGSQVIAVLFHQDDWTRSEAARWLGPEFTADHGNRTYSSGGRVLKPGAYWRFPVAYSGPKPTSYGYKKVSSKYPGVYFQIAGHRGRDEDWGWEE